MQYAIVENGLVVNITIGIPKGIHGVLVDDRPVSIGDKYAEGVFTRNGEIVMTDAERITALEARIAELEAQT